MRRIVLTGIAGRLGRRVAQRLLQHYEVIGIDSRPYQGLDDTIEFYQTDLRRRAAEEIFRQGNIDAVVHLGMVHNFRIDSKKLYERNVMETETLLRYVS